LFDDAERMDLKNLTYRQLMCKLIGADDDYNIIEEMTYFLNLEENSSVIKIFQWLGFFSNEPLPDENNLMDIFSHLLQEKLSMKAHELDMIVLYHRFIAQYETKRELITSTLVQTGIPEGDSAMSRTVSLPAAIATALILEGKIGLTGVHIPVQPEIYTPVLNELSSMNIRCQEKTIAID